MSLSIRPATQADLSAMADLLVKDGEQRQSQDAALWSLAADARTRVETAIRAGLENANPQMPQRWLLAEAAGRIVGITHAMVVQPPPIYDIAAGPPGLFLDDCFTTDEAPSGTAEALLLATEAALRDAGAAGMIASCVATGPWRPLYERHGYEAVTLYLAKAGFRADALSPAVRPADADDLPGIVERSAAHRATLSRLNDRFWHIHPEADRRFEMWMRYSLTLKDREMFVAGAPGEVHGYIIAQPIAPLLVPAAHDIAAIGVIDDFYDLDFADVSTTASDGTTASALLSAAQSTFARRSFAAALTVCPAAWTSKRSFLEREGFKTAKLWMLKR